MRDHLGTIIATGIQLFGMVVSVERAQALAILQGFKIVEQLGLIQVVVEIDCQVVVSAINGKILGGQSLQKKKRGENNDCPIIRKTVIFTEVAFRQIETNCN